MNGVLSQRLNLGVIRRQRYVETETQTTTQAQTQTQTQTQIQTQTDRTEKEFYLPIFVGIPFDVVSLKGIEWSTCCNCSIQCLWRRTRKEKQKEKQKQKQTQTQKDKGNMNFKILLASKVSECARITHGV